MLTVEKNIQRHTYILKMAQLETPLGPMLAIADEQALHRLEFVDQRDLAQELAHFSRETESVINSGRSHSIDSIEQELNQYFAGTLTEFKTPVLFHGTPFQQSVWRELKKIPYGITRSYADVAEALGKPTAFRAVAQANGANNLAIIIPCHRVINSNGELGGYNGGLARKEWLLSHERKR